MSAGTEGGRRWWARERYIRRSKRRWLRLWVRLHHQPCSEWYYREGCHARNAADRARHAEAPHA